MHTTVYKYKKDILEDGEIRFFYNGCFKGNVQIYKENGDTITVPFDALEHLVGEYIRSKKIQEIEFATTDELFGL